MCDLIRQKVVLSIRVLSIYSWPAFFLFVKFFLYSSGSDADGGNDEDDQIEYGSLVDVMFKEDKELDHEYLALTVKS